MFVRDRLEGEYHIWKQNKTFTPAWAADCRIFEFLRTHRELKKDSSLSNWVTLFSTSVDLKAQLTVAFKSASDKRLLGSWLREGRLPYANIEATNTHLGPSNTLLVDLQITIYPPKPGFKVEFSGAGKTYPLGDFGVGGTRPVRVILPNSSPPTDEMFSLSYVTDFGARIEDTFCMRRDPKGPGLGIDIRNESKRLISPMPTFLE